MVEWINDIFTSDFGWNVLTDLTNIGSRMAGGQGEQQAATTLLEALADTGARNIRKEPFDLTGWVRGSSTLITKHGEHQCIALPRSPTGAASGNLINLGFGLPGDFQRGDVQGNIVIVSSGTPSYIKRPIHRREKYCRAVDAGAAGFIFKSTVDGNLPLTGSVGTKTAPIGAIPAVSVSKEVGEKILRDSENKDIEITVDANITDTQSQNIHAEIGPETDEQILLTSHYDAHDISEGAMDNGAGTALNLEIINAIGARQTEIDTKIHLIAFGAEEVGFVGSEHAANNIDTESVKTTVNNDGVVRSRDLSFYYNGFTDLREVASEIAEYYSHPITLTPTIEPFSDHWPFVAKGIPGYHIKSEPESSGRGWGHTSADTLDKLEVRNLREQAILLSELIDRLAEQDRTIARAEPSEIAAQVEDALLKEGMIITDEWPYN